MSANPVFLNCRVRKVDGSPVAGIYARSLCLAQPSTVFDGCTDSAGEIWGWSHHQDTTDQGQYWLRCSEGSYWRVFIDIPNHPFPSLSADLCISGNTDTHANITLIIAPHTVAISNGSMEDISRRNGISLRDLTPGSTGPYIAGPRRSSSMGSISGISSFTLDSEQMPILNDARSIVSPTHSPRSSGEISRAGDIVLEEWFETQTGMEAGTRVESFLGHKRKHVEEDFSDENMSVKRVKTCEGY